jgi:hypothetical protein
LDSGADKVGCDLYTQTFTTQVLSLVVIILTFTSMMAVDGGTLASQVQNNQFSGSMVGFYRPSVMF